MSDFIQQHDNLVWTINQIAMSNFPSCLDRNNPYHKMYWKDSIFNSFIEYTSQYNAKFFDVNWRLVINNAYNLTSKTIKLLYNL